MRVTADGRFLVQPGASIDIETQARGISSNLVSFPPDAVCSAGGTPIAVTVSGLIRTGAFTAPAGTGSSCSVVLLFNFQPIPEGEDDRQSYSVAVVETRSDGARSRIPFGTVTRLMPFALPFDFVTE